MSKHVCDHTRCIERDGERKAYQMRFVQEVERLMEPHKPYADDWGLRPGNSHAQVPFYCEVCRTPWPCRTFNELRGLYGVVEEWKPATLPYPPLVLERATDTTTKPEPTDPTPEGDADE